MKKNIPNHVNVYYASTFERINKLKQLVYGVAFSLCSYPRLFLEVFFRTDMGERYINWYSVAFGLFILWTLPFRYSGMLHTEVYTVIMHNLLWYAFSIVYVVFGIFRLRETAHAPGVFDFKRFSLSSGLTRYRLYEFWTEALGKTPHQRTMEIWLEPLPFFLAGVILLFFGQSLGYLLTSCSICYCVSYLGAYWQGDVLMMELIDKIQSKEESMNILKNRAGSNQTRGFHIRARLPESPYFRSRVLDQLNGRYDDDATDVF